MTANWIGATSSSSTRTNSAAIRWLSCSCRDGCPSASTGAGWRTDAGVLSINDHNRAAFNALFAATAVVNDVGREFRGSAAVKAWSDREIFTPLVTLEVIDVADQGGATVVTTKVEGNFDRTGLPDPVIIKHHITAAGGKIVGLTCRLGGEGPGT